MASLKPLDLKKEVKDYEAFSEEKELKFERCPHRNTEIKDGELRCLNCSAAWSGPGINRLQKLLSGE